MAVPAALLSGLAGAGALTALHETVRRTVPHPPRMDILGMRALAQGLRLAGHEPQPGAPLHEAALAGDLVANTLYYSVVGASDAKDAPLCGALLGLTAGIGALVLPGPLGLGTAPSTRTPATAALTVGLYLVGGLVAGMAYQAFQDGQG
jgi:hypothetical protein